LDLLKKKLKIKMQTTTTKLKINKWSDYLFKLDTELTQHLSQPSIVTQNKISLAIESFKELLFSKSNTSLGITSNSDYKLLIIFKIKTINNIYRSISYMQIISLAELDKLKKYSSVLSFQNSINNCFNWSISSKFIVCI
jgi:hypothetical protein